MSHVLADPRLQRESYWCSDAENGGRTNRDAMLELGMACDGGKDSLSMAASAGGETVKAPGNLVVSAYVRCPDITATVTPDLKLPGAGRLLHVDLAAGRRRLGGSNLAQAFSQVRLPGMRTRQLMRSSNSARAAVASGG